MPGNRWKVWLPALLATAAFLSTCQLPGPSFDTTGASASVGDPESLLPGTWLREYRAKGVISRHVLVLDALREKDKLIYNLGTGQGFSVREVIDTARHVTGHSIPARESARRPGDPAVLVASSDKIKRELLWRPRFPALEDIVRSAWEWRRARPNGYAS